MKTNIISLFTIAVVLSLALHPTSMVQADTIKDALNAAGNAAESIGNSVADTAGAVGNSIENTYDSVTGDRTPAMVRKEVDELEPTTLSRLFREYPETKKVFKDIYGYAIFDSNKKGLMISSSSGVGVAVQKSPQRRTYMRMASLGASIGGGIQYFKLIFFFENKASYDSFINSGWEAKGEGDMVMGKDSLSTGVRFVDGKAIFALNDTGVMLGANISGTKYWKDQKLNTTG